MSKKTEPEASRYLENVSLYKTASHKAPTDLRLDSNLPVNPPVHIMKEMAKLDAVEIGRYVPATDLESKLAGIHEVQPSQVLVTSGADEAIDRICRAFIPNEREILVPVPTFEMIPSFAKVSGAVVRSVSWPEGPFPTDKMIENITDRTGIVVIVSPNNPTGLTATPVDLERISKAAPHAVILLDVAYGPFADVSLLPMARNLNNVISVQTFSKAWGLAGLRVGYALGPDKLIDKLRVAGAPFPVSSLSLRLAERWLDRGVEQVGNLISTVRSEREKLSLLLAKLGAAPLPSQANFVFARPKDPDWLRDAMAGLGISLRPIAAEDGFEAGIRISCPGDDASFKRLQEGIETVLSPEALLFDMDGVLADVSDSYREVIRLTASHFGVELTADEISKAKNQPAANNDWEVTRRLLADHGKSVSLEDVKKRFERLYHGSKDDSGLKEHERLIPSRQFLDRLAAKYPLAIVTGRPRSDAEQFIKRFNLGELFRAVVCMEDATCKPDPAPLRLALNRLGVNRAWMLGDVPDDLQAAKRAGVLPIAFMSEAETDQESRTALYEAGAARILSDLESLEELLP